MWDHYWRTLVPMQLFILAACGGARYFGTPALAVALIFVVMQLGSVLGAAWAARLRRLAARRDDMLPLQRRRR